MFFDGDLESGISLALQESKYVVCFVRDEGALSSLWENEWLQESQTAEELNAKAIVLRIQAHSLEAGYLTAFYPLSSFPTLLIISNGQLHADLVAGISQTLFKECLIQKLNTPSTRPSSSTLNTNPSTNTSSSMHAVLDERRKRLEADKKRMDAEEKARRMAKAQARREEANTADLDSARAKQAVYALQQRKRQQESRQERERILQVIGNDRIERKERDKLRKDFSRVKSDGYDGAGDLVDAQFLGETGSSRPFASNECAIQIRLLDGSTIRSRFSSEQSLRDSVRPWIDMERPDSIRTPYTFKHVLTPLPNRPILITEEEESLQFLGLQPSATLIMVPVRNCVKIYGEDPGPLSKGLSLGYSVLSSGLGMLSGALGMLLGTGQSAASSTLDETLHRDSRNTLSTAASDLGANVNIRTLRDQRPDQDVRQLYNGNQLNFEPRNQED